VPRQPGTTLEAGDGIVRIGRRVASAVLDPRRWRAPALPCGAFFMVLLDGTNTIVALPSTGARLRSSERFAMGADNANQDEEQTMTIYEYLVKAVQDDARRAGERHRLLLEARQARRARRQRPAPAAPARHSTETGKIVVSENVTPDGVIQDRPVTKASGPAAGPP
jgi:hypothetical protein